MATSSSSENPVNARTAGSNCGSTDLVFFCNTPFSCCVQSAAYSGAPKYIRITILEITNFFTVLVSDFCLTSIAVGKVIHFLLYEFALGGEFSHFFRGRRKGLDLFELGFIELGLL